MNAEVEVGAGGTAGVAGAPDLLTLLDDVALVDGRPRQMEVQRADAAAVGNDDDRASEKRVTHECDRSIFDRRALRASRRREIGAQVLRTMAVFAHGGGIS